MSAEAKIREALAAGPTPGPWTASNRGSYGVGVGDEGSVYGPDGEDTGAEFVKPIGDQPTIRGEFWYRDAAYVAACNPVAMTELLAELDRLRAEVEGLRASVLEEAAKVCDGLRDDAKEVESLAKFQAASVAGSQRDELDRGEFWLTVSTFNAGLKRAASAIRALSGPKGQGSGELYSGGGDE